MRARGISNQKLLRLLIVINRKKLTMKFAKIPYSTGNGFQLINVDLIEAVMVNQKSGTGVVLMLSKERIPLSQIEMKSLLERISAYNIHYQNHLSGGSFSSTEKNNF